MPMCLCSNSHCFLFGYYLSPDHPACVSHTVFFCTLPSRRLPELLAMERSFLTVLAYDVSPPTLFKFLGFHQHVVSQA